MQDHFFTCMDDKIRVLRVWPNILVGVSDFVFWVPEGIPGLHRGLQSSPGMYMYFKRLSQGQYVIVHALFSQKQTIGELLQTSVESSPDKT